MPNLGEHKIVANSVVLNGLDGKDQRLKLNNGLNVTFGDIAGIAGDFIGAKNLEIVSTAKDDTEKQKRFLSAYDNIANNPDYIPYVKELLRHASEEVLDIEKTMKRGGTALGYYNANAWIRDLTWTNLSMKYPKVQGYLDLAGQNVDHFGAHALECYRVGHTLAIKEMKNAYAVKDSNKDEFRRLLMRGYSIEAFAFHFFTDLFTAGHHRVPRAQIYKLYEGNPVLSPFGGLLAKAQHDEDGKTGLTFNNSLGHEWKVYGDCQLLDDVDGNKIQGRRVIHLAMQAIVDELYEIATSGKEPEKNPGYDYLPQITGNNSFPLFKIKESTADTLLRRTDVSDPNSSAYTEDWDAMTTYSEILTSSEKRKATQLVEKGDWIITSPDHKQVETIKWQQNLFDYETKYIVLPFLVKDKTKGSLFIAEEKIDIFFSQCTENDDKSVMLPGVKCYRIKVTDAFQYGQNSEKTMRFLVFHNKENKPFQHRFVQTSAFGNLMSTIMDVRIGEGSTEIFKDFIGDPLRDF